MRIARHSVAIVALAAGCATPANQQPPDDLSETCAAGQIADGSTCVPEACAQAPWGAAADATTFVDAAAAATGDGSADKPFRSLTEALVAGTDIAIAAGTYVEAISLFGSVDGLRIRGRCAALVTLDGSTGAADARTFRMAARGTASIEGITITGGQNCGLGVSSGTLDAKNVVVSGNTACGAVTDVAGTLSMVDSTLADNHMTSSASVGRGLIVLAHSSATLTRTVVSANQHVGVYAKGIAAFLSLDDVDVIGTRADDGDPNGYGIEVLEGATASVTGSRIADNIGIGILADGVGTTVTVVDSTITGTLPGEVTGRGVAAQAGAAVTLQNTSVAGNSTLGVTSAGTGTTVSLDNVDITGVLPPPGGTSGYGLEVMRGGSAIALNSTVTGAFGAGILATGAGSALQLDGVTVTATHTLGNGTAGTGILIQDGAAASMRDCTVNANHSTGLLVTGAGTALTMIDSLVSGTLGAGHSDGTGAPDGRGRGVEVNDGARLDTRRSSVSGNREVGILVSGETTVVTLDADEVLTTSRGPTNGYGVGVIAQNGATVVATSVRVANQSGPGMVSSDGASLTCTLCAIESNTFAGAVVDAATLDLTLGTVRYTAADATGGGGVGVFTTPAPGSAVSIDGASVLGQPLASVWLGGAGTFLLRESVLESGSGVELRPGLTAHGNAVYAGSGVLGWNGESGFLLDGNTLTSGPGPAVLLDGAGVTSQGNSWDTAATSIVQQACGGSPPTVDADDAPVIDRCPNADQLVLPMVFSIDLTESEALSE